MSDNINELVSYIEQNNFDIFCKKIVNISSDDDQLKISIIINELIINKYDNLLIDKLLENMTTSSYFLNFRNILLHLNHDVHLNIINIIFSNIDKLSDEHIYILFVTIFDIGVSNYLHIINNIFNIIFIKSLTHDIDLTYIFSLYLQTEQYTDLLYNNLIYYYKTDLSTYLFNIFPDINTKIQNTTPINYIDFKMSNISNSYQKLYGFIIWYLLNHTIYKKLSLDNDNLKKIINLINIFFNNIDIIYSNEIICQILNILKLLLSYPLSTSTINIISQFNIFLPFIIDGVNGHLNNPHLRIDAVNILSTLYKYNIKFDHNHYNIQYTLFNYLKDVKYITLMHSYESFIHTQSILDILYYYISIMKDTFYTYYPSNIRFMTNDLILFTLLTTIDNIAEQIITQNLILTNKTIYKSFSILCHTAINILNCIIKKNNSISSYILLFINNVYFKIIQFFLNILNKNNHFHNLYDYNLLQSICDLYDHIIHTKQINIQNFDSNMLISLLNILTNINLNTKKNILTFIHSDEFIHNIHNTDNISDDFIDPIFAIPILHPIMLPNNNDIYDYDSIILYILKTEQHPLTRQSLSLSDLLDFNNSDDIKHLLNNYTIKINNYLSHINYKK